MLANQITAVRLLALIPLYWLIMQEGTVARWAALAVFALAGLSDILDGWVARRFGLTSRFGAFLDLAADRLLTMMSLTALLVVGSLPGWWALAALVLIARCVVVASLGEAFGDQGLQVTGFEKAKIALQFLGVALLIAPPLSPAQPLVGRVCLALAAVIAAWLVSGYIRRALALGGR
jgi:CDP-diacylglycerol--glycerol-3-phosphate 3-phosphatidyltransferase